MEKLSTLIVKINIEYKLSSLIKNFCNIENITVITSEFLNKLKNILLYNDKFKQTNLRILFNLPLSDLPSYLIVNKASTNFRKSITLNGYRTDLAKSGIQKYIRRAYPDKAIYFSNEMIFFNFIPDGKSLYTNFYNRLRVILLEDIGIASPYAIPICNDLLNRIRSRNLFESFEVIPKLMYIMSNTMHARTFSQLRAFLTRNQPMIKDVESSDFDIGKDIGFQTNVNLLIDCLERKDISAWWWASLIINSEEKLKTKRYNSTDSGLLVFAVLEWFFNKIEIPNIIRVNFETCLDWFKSLKVKERIICIFHPMYLYILKDKLDFSRPINVFSENFKSDLLVKNLLNEKIYVDRFVIDMHTNKGRNINRNSINFVSEGSLVAFEDVNLNLPRIRQAYILQNFEKEGAVLRSETYEFTLKARAQLTCSNAKQDTYYASDREGNNVVVKGPFLDYKTAVNSFKISKILSLFSKINVMDINILLLEPDMFENVPLGTRTKIERNRAYYFSIFSDVFDRESYPVIRKSSKLWKDERVIDYVTLFSENTTGGVERIGFGTPDTMSEKTKISFIYQIGIRIAFELGDFASRNFIYKNDKVYNLDMEGVLISKNIDKIKKSYKKLILETYLENREEINQVFEKWLDVSSEENPVFYDRWLIIKRTLGLEDKEIERIKNNIRQLINDFETLFAY